MKNKPSNISNMKRRRFIKKTGGLALGSMVLANVPGLIGSQNAMACIPEWADDPIAGQNPKRGGILTYGQTYPNWALGRSKRGEHPYYWLDLLTKCCWNGLTWVDENLDWQPDLAETVTSNQAMDVWTYKLRKGVMFHDGTEFTSADAISSLEFHSTANGFFRKSVRLMETPDKYTLIVHLNTPNAEFPYLTAEYRLVMMKAGSKDQIGYDGIGTGPFKLVDIDNARQFRAVRNENYYMENKPYLDEVKGVIATGNNAINGFQAGQLNAVFNIDPGQIGQYKSAGGQIHAAPAGDQFWLILPKNLGYPWNDVRVRKAMSLAIDRPGINRIVYQDPEGWTGNDSHMTGVNREFLPRPVERDVAQAKKLLAEAGHPNGIDLPQMYFCSSFPEEPRIYPIVQESMKDAGIRIKFPEQPCDGFSAANAATNKPIGRPRRNLVGPRNPAINLTRLSDQNPSEPGGWTGAAHDRYNELLPLALKEPDAKKRMSIYHEMQKVAQEDVPGIMLGGRRNMVAFKSGINNLRSHSQNWSSRFENVWMDS